MVRILGNTLPLQVFIRRAQAISAYRQLLRAARGCEDAVLRKDLSQQIKVEFQRHRDVQDAQLIRSCIQEALKSVKKVQDVAGASRPAAETASKRSVKSEPGSWLDVQDEEDKRGRVGQGWPWEQ